MANLRLMRGFLVTCALVWACGWANVTGWAQGRAQVRLLSDHQTIVAGSSWWVGVEITPPTGWHTYWVNSGDSGQATRLDWVLPTGITAGDIQWPVPERYEEAGLTTFVLSGPVILPVRLQAAPGIEPGPKTVSVRVRWLECLKECLPGRAEVSTEITVGATAVPSRDQPEILRTVAALPVVDDSILASFTWAGPDSASPRPLQVATDAGRVVDFFPYSHQAVEGAMGRMGDSGEGLRLAVVRSGDTWPDRLAGVLALAQPQGSIRYVQVEGPVTSASTLASGSAPGSPATSSAVASLSLWAMLGSAFLGGLILNIMPCVLPVIALKILGFVKQSQENAARVRVYGGVYTLGVLASFGVMAVLVMVVQSAGRIASWGMQFQNPIFVVAITTLVTLVALNLFGVFEVNLASSATGAASELAGRQGVSGAFFSGVFTTVLATPCTAPFLGVALGFAFGRPPIELMLLFLTAGLGLAAPYLLLSLQPQWLRFLPRPGPWMVTFKILMGFPMLATAFWLLSVAQVHFGPGSTFTLGLFLVLVSLAAWLYGRLIQGASRPRPWAWVTLGAVLVAAYWGVLERELQWRNPPPTTTAGGVIRSGGLEWRPWSEETVAELRSRGIPVLVDFTAVWCATCQVNKRVAIEVAEVRDRLASMGAVTLRADFTLEDPQIAEEIRRHGRAAVPLVLVYPRDARQAPRILPEAITKGMVLEALDWADAPVGTVAGPP